MKKMTKKLFLLIVLSFIVIICSIYYYGYQQLHSIRLNVIETENGWAYNILNNNQVFIHQPNIPAIQNTKAFKSKADAKKVGNLVLQKIKTNSFPVVSKEELDSLKIQY